jgi:hypothetical protein
MSHTHHHLTSAPLHAPPAGPVPGVLQGNLVAERLYNITNSPFYRLLPKGRLQSAAFIWRNGGRLYSGLGLENKKPMWYAADFGTVAPNDTQDITYSFPDGTVLLAVLPIGFPQGEAGPGSNFKVQLLDTNVQLPFQMQPVIADLYGGNGSSTLFLNEPYELAPQGAQMALRVINIAPVPNIIQVALFIGVEMEDWAQK